jgi:RNA polymerase sigma factor (sigma-70 family)
LFTRNCFFDLAQARKTDPSRAPRHGTSLDQEDGARIQFFDPDRETPEGVLVRPDETEKVRAVIETLLEPFREALVLRELEELSYQQIAAITAVPIGTVMSRLSRGRQMFAEAWQEFIGKRDASGGISS